MEESSFKRFLIKIWPTIYRVINTLVYALLNFLKSAVSQSIEQLKGK
ncbi:MAG: hypothetical protein V1697_01470 [Candidatus Levyibacteriota bacterium]